MDKDFDNWNGIKKQIHKKDTYLPLYHERQIRWCRLGVSVGFEVFKVIRKAVKDML